MRMTRREQEVRARNLRGYAALRNSDGSGWLVTDGDGQVISKAFVGMFEAMAHRDAIGGYGVTFRTGLRPDEYRGSRHEHG